ncbi:MAG: hypothetical protein ACO3N7_05840 [Kiritimatiellia bacterium]
MNTNASLLLAGLALLPLTRAAETEIAVRLTGGGISLEGPAITGPDTEIEGEDGDGYGLQLQITRDLSNRFYTTALLDWAAWDDNFQMWHLTAGVGRTFPLHTGESFSLGTYLLLSAEYVSVSGLEEYRGHPDFGGLGTGEDGDDIGFGAETGLTLAASGGWAGTLYGKYYNFGDGDGPSFGIRVEKALSDTWTLQGAWDGMWVEESGYTIDLDTQKLTLGLARRF